MAKYTELHQIDIPAVAERYALERPRLTALAGGAANSSFRLSSGGGDCVLTILDNHDLPSAQRLAAHTQAFFRLGVPTSEVVPAVDGSLIIQLDGRPVMLKKWVEGAVRQPLPISLLPEAGRILARLHTLPVDASGLADIPVGTRRLSGGQLDAIPRFEDRDFASWLAERLDRVRADEELHARPRKVVHGDLFDDNVLVDARGRLTILDWETVSIDDPLLDLGMAAVGLAQRDGALAPERLDALVGGYDEVMPLSAEDRASLPMEIEHAALIIAFHRYHRHNVRFPDPTKKSLHSGMIDFVHSVVPAARSVG